MQSLPTKTHPHAQHSSHNLRLNNLLICFFFVGVVLLMAGLIMLRLDGNQKRRKAYHALGFLCVMLLIQQSYARDFLVGGNGQWGASTDNNTANYNQWAEKNRFQIGDSLVFNYQAGQDSVLQVTREAYSNCSTTDTSMANFTNGHTVFPFNHSGAFYFISGNKDNCLKNQKVVVIVMAERNSNQTYSPPPSGSTEVLTPSPAPDGDYSPPAGTVEINPTPSPESPPSAASSTSFSLAGYIIGVVFGASSLVLAF